MQAQVIDNAELHRQGGDAMLHRPTIEFSDGPHALFINNVRRALALPEDASISVFYHQAEGVVWYRYYVSDDTTLQLARQRQPRKIYVDIEEGEGGEEWDDLE